MSYAHTIIISGCTFTQNSSSGTWNNLQSVIWNSGTNNWATHYGSGGPIAYGTGSTTINGWGYSSYPYMEVGCDITAKDDEKYDIGSKEKRFRTIYVTELDVVELNGVEVCDIVTRDKYETLMQRLEDLEKRLYEMEHDNEK